MPNIICVTNQKGGVAKTTTCANVAAALAEQRRRVLIVDLDPQAGLTLSFGVDPSGLKSTIYEVLLGKTPLKSVLVPTQVKGVTLAPANPNLAAIEIDLARTIGWEKTLSEVLAESAGEYTDVLIDCPPALGMLCSMALVASHLALIPMQAEFLAMQGLRQLNDTVAMVRKRSNPYLKTRIVVTMFNPRVLHSQEVLKEIQELFGDYISSQIIKRTIRFADSTLTGKPLVASDPDSDVAQAYRQLTKEMLQYVKT